MSTRTAGAGEELARAEGAQTHEDRWKKPAHNTRLVLTELESMFQVRFEEEL